MPKGLYSDKLTTATNFRTARDMQEQIEKLQVDLAATKKYHAEVSKALQVRP